MISGVESAWLKVERAKTHIKAIQERVLEYAPDESNLIFEQSDGKQKLHFPSEPPPDIAILVGEAVYQLRSALDHLAFDLVKMNDTKIELPTRWIQDCEFPIYVDVPVTGNPPVPHALPLPYNFFKKCLPGISKSAFAFIESLQPYYGGNGLPHLSWLKKLSNIDKHRHLHIVNPQAYQSEYIRSPRFNSEAIVRLRDGAELMPALHTEEQLADAVYMERGITGPFVSFDESALGKYASDLPVDNILELCTEAISGTVIPGFEKLIDQAP